MTLTSILSHGEREPDSHVFMPREDNELNGQPITPLRTLERWDVGCGHVPVGSRIMTWAFLAVVIVVAFATETAAGFGATILTLTFGAFFFKVDPLLAILLPINCVTSALLIWRGRKLLAWSVLLTDVAVPISVGFAIGLVARSRIPTDKLVIVFALFVAALAIHELRKIAKGVALPSPAYAPLWIFGGGVMQGLFGTGGPLVVYTLSHRIEDKGAFRSTLAVVWLALNLGLVASLVNDGGAFSRTSLLASAALTLPMLLGMALGEAVFKRLRPQTFRKFIYQLLLVASLLLLLRSVR